MYVHLKTLLSVLAVFLPASCAIAAESPLNSLSVEFSPAPSVYFRGDYLFARATSDAPAAEYRFVLERLVAGEYVDFPGCRQYPADRGWGTGSEFWDFAGCSVPGPYQAGIFRLTVYARSLPGKTVMMSRSNVFRVLAPGDPGYAAIANARKDQVCSNYFGAIAKVRDTLASVKAKLLAQQDVSEEFNAFVTSDHLIVNIISPENEEAPGGERAFLAAGANDQTGAVGVQVRTSPASPDNWAGTAVEIDLPNYLDMDANGDRMVTIRWED